MSFFIGWEATKDVERDRLFWEFRFCGRSLNSLFHALGFGNAAKKALAAEGLNLLLELKDVKLILQFGYDCFGRSMSCENMEVFTVEEEFSRHCGRTGRIASFDFLQRIP